MDHARLTDEVTVTLDRRRDPGEAVSVRGFVTAELRGPDGTLLAECRTHNLITQVGDQYVGERAAGIASPPAQVTGMKLGTGSTAPAKTGAGAALATYLSGSDQAMDATYPQSSLNGSARRITWKVTYAAGTATTALPITEAVLVNDALADSTSTAANTIARALLTGIGSKGSGDSLTMIWTTDVVGS